MTDSTPAPTLRYWILVLGAVGFAAGFIGPMLLNPDANQGPMVGIFITGPGGALLGLVLGAVCRVLPVSNAARYRVLAVTAAALGLVTLYYCLPPPETAGYLIDGTVRNCQRPEELKDAAIRDWEQRIAAAPWGKPREGWRQQVDGMLSGNTGVVLTLDVRRQNRILRHRKPWDAHRLTAEGWTTPPSQQSYFADFAGDSCTAYAGDLPPLYLEYGQGSNLWPPADVPNFLGLARVVPAPARYLQLATH